MAALGNGRAVPEMSMLPLHLTDEDQQETLTPSLENGLDGCKVEELVEKVKQLTKENREMRMVLQQNNDLMNKTVQSLTNYEKKMSRDQVEYANNCETAKKVVTELKRKLNEQESVSEVLRQRLTEAMQQKPAEDVRLQNLQAQIAGLAEKLITANERSAATERENVELQRKLKECQNDLSVERSNRDGTLGAKMEELLSDYHDLLVQNETTKKKELESRNQVKELSEKCDNLVAQLICSEDTLQCKDDEIAALNKRLDHTMLLAEQAKVFRGDFEAERESRVALNDKKNELEEQVQELMARVHLLETELARPGSFHPSKTTQPAAYSPAPLNYSINPRTTANSTLAAPVIPYDAPGATRDVGMAGAREDQAFVNVVHVTRPATPLQVPTFTANTPGKDAVTSGQGMTASSPARDSQGSRTPTDPLTTTMISDFECPFCCGYSAPEYDSLLLHVNDNHQES